jgi:hypothetical protein
MTPSVISHTMFPENRSNNLKVDGPDKHTDLITPQEFASVWSKEKNL